MMECLCDMFSNVQFDIVSAVDNISELMLPFCY